MKDYEEKVLNIMDSAKDNIRTQLDKAYKSGYEDAKSELGKNVIDLAHKEIDRAYQQGLEDAWEAAKKIHDGQIPYEVFGLDKTGSGFTYASPLNWGETITAQEAISKIKDYEKQQKQDAIQVGDEVYSEEDDLRFVVTRIYEGVYEGVCTDGAAYCPLPNDIKKTGRHTETILKVLGEFDEKD